MLFAHLLLIANLVSSSPCDEVDRESLITDSIVDGTDKVWIFEGDGAATFMKSLEDAGIISGVKSHIDKIYVTEYRMVYHVFFVDGGCIIGAYDFFRPLLEGKLP